MEGEVVVVVVVVVAGMDHLLAKLKFGECSEGTQVLRCSVRLYILQIQL